jgi:maleylpyruvate isomerase
VPEPTDFLLGLRASTADLIQGLDGEQWSDADISAPSLCAGWTRGHVLTHLAGNADGIAATLAGALRNEIVARYPGGWDARNQAIEDGAGRPLAALLADVAASAERLDRVLGAVDDAGAWDRPTDQGKVAADWLYRRWREVEIHRVDLAGSYQPRRWPPLLVTALLSELGPGLADRAGTALRVHVEAEGSLAPEHVGTTWECAGADEPIEVRGPDWAVAAWAVGRGSVADSALSAVPDLGPWG